MENAERLNSDAADQPVLLEVFADSRDENEALKQMRTLEVSWEKKRTAAMKKLLRT